MSSYMESKMDEYIESGIRKQEELEKEFDRFSDWFVNLIGDIDETLVERKYLDERFNLNSPSVEAQAMWLGWKASKGL